MDRTSDLESLSNKIFKSLDSDNDGFISRD